MQRDTGNLARTGGVRVVLPAVLAAALVAWVVLGHITRVRAEAAGTEFLARLHRAQQAFQAGTGGFASALESLMASCPSGGGPWLDAAALGALGDAGYEVHLRPSTGARTLGRDCQGRPTVADYYVGVQPVGARVAAQRAYASTAAGRIFVFVDGVAPREPDMVPGGLATPLEDLATFRIP